LYITSGGGGGSLYASRVEGGYHHYLSITISDTDISVQPVELEPDPDPKCPEVVVKGKNSIEVFDLEMLGSLTSKEGISSFENQYNNVRSYGKYNGVTLGDLIKTAGDMDTDDIIIVQASDGYYIELGYMNIYPNETVRSSQGDLILAYVYENDTVPDWKDGFRLVALAPDGLYSNLDAQITTPEGLPVPVSAGSRWVRNVNLITIKTKN
jgi:hypothetical protein